MSRKSIRTVARELIAEFMGDLALLYPRLPVLIVRLAERVHLLFVSQRPEPVEIANLILGAAWFAPLAVNPHYLETSPYLQQVGARFSREQCLCTFVFLFLYWGVCCAFGGPPSVFISDNKHVLFWLNLRRVGLLVAVFVWLSAAQILSFEGFGGGTIIYGGAAVVNSFVLLFMGWNTIVEKERLWNKQSVTGNGATSKTRRVPRIKRRAAIKTAGR